MSALLADGTLATSKNRVSISKKDKEAIDFVASLMLKLGIKYTLIKDSDKFRLTTKEFESLSDLKGVSPDERHEIWENSVIYNLLYT